MKTLIIFLLLGGLGLIALWVFLAHPMVGFSPPSKVVVDPQRLRSHVEILVRDFSPRSYLHLDNLNGAAGYIEKQFRNAGAVVESQDFEVSGRQYRNIIARFGQGKGGRFIIGAHYDTCGETPGADDNGSGIAALLELARLFGQEENLPREIELVAYSLEEPPHFTTPAMGSHIHASRLGDAVEEVGGVVVLETIGYFSDSWGAQSYPFPLLHLFYPSRGDFIAVVGRSDQRGFTGRVKAGMKGRTELPVHSINAPAAVPGIDFSDHRSYWPYGIQAVMITDTAFYRNHAYHGPDDTPERLDYVRMSQVVVMVFEMVRGWGGGL